MVTKMIGKKKTYCLVVFVLFFLYPLSAYALFGGKIDSYSADSVTISPDGKIVSESQYYFTPDAQRIDGFPGPQHPSMDKMDLSMLILIKEKKQYFYNHEKKLVYEDTVDEKDLKPGYENFGDIKSEKVLGKEKVSGYKCTKKEVVTTHKMMGMTSKNTVIVWESERFEMPLRVQDENGGLMEMRNIKTGKPAKKHFKPIQGYKKVSNMMAVMGMDFGNMSMGDEPPSAPAEVTSEEPQLPTTASKETVEEESPPQSSEMNRENIGKALQGLGNKLKNFKFGD